MHVNEPLHVPAYDTDGYIILDGRSAFVHHDEEEAMTSNRHEQDMSRESIECRTFGRLVYNELCVPQEQDFNCIKVFAEQKHDKAFVLGTKLGEGQFSKVYVGWLKNQRMAVKSMRLTDIGEEYLKKFLPREIDCWQRFDHQNLTRLFGLVRGQNYVVMFTELAPYGDLLRVVLLMEKVGFLKSTFWMSQIVRAVDYLHASGIAHRDLKLENCLLFENEVVKVTDFGFCARMRDARMMSTTHCGSRLYSAPEILENREYNPFKADVWSLGVIAATLVNNTMPFYDNPDDPTHHHVLEQQRKSVISVPLDFGNMCQFSINKLLTYDSNKRPDIHAAMLLPWWRRLTTSKKSLAQQRLDIFHK